MTRADYSDVVIVEIPAVYCEKRRCESVSQKRGLRYASCSRNKATSIQLGLQLEAQLLKDVPAWEAGNGRQFLVNSEPFLQLLEETLCAEEAQRESRKVCGDHLSVYHRPNRLYSVPERLRWLAVQQHQLLQCQPAPKERPRRLSARFLAL